MGNKNHGRTRFRFTDAAAEMSTLLELGKLDLPPAARKEIQRAGVDILDRLTGVPEDRKKLILDAIAASDDLPSAAPDPSPALRPVPSKRLRVGESASA